jgi:hypothetical protein
MVQYDRSEREINEITRELDTIKDQLCTQAGSADFANEIDELVYNDIGKGPIRERISKLRYADLSDPGTRADAQQVCNLIYAFNRSVIDLGKRVVGRS